MYNLFDLKCIAQTWTVSLTLTLSLNIWLDRYRMTCSSFMSYRSYLSNEINNFIITISAIIVHIALLYHSLDCVNRASSWYPDVSQQQLYLLGHRWLCCSRRSHCDVVAALTLCMWCLWAEMVQGRRWYIHSVRAISMRLINCRATIFKRGTAKLTSSYYCLS